MAKDQTRRLSPSIRAEDIETLERLKTIQGYAPANPAYSKAALETAIAEMRAAETEELQAEAILEQKRAIANERQWKTHNTAVGVRDSVVVQFGKNSVEVQMVGRKTEAERKRPSGKPPKPDANK